MKAKHVFLGIAALLAAGGLWFAWSAWRSDESAYTKPSSGYASSDGQKSSDRDKSSVGQESKAGADFGTPQGQPQPGRRLRPPIPNRRFADFTPEQRVEFARKGRGPGG